MQLKATIKAGKQPFGVYSGAVALTAEFHGAYNQTTLSKTDKLASGAKSAKPGRRANNNRPAAAAGDSVFQKLSSFQKPVFAGGWHSIYTSHKVGL